MTEHRLDVPPMRVVRAGGPDLRLASAAVTGWAR